jgi:hypothetical protein
MVSEVVAMVNEDDCRTPTSDEVKVPYAYSCEFAV